MITTHRVKREDDLEAICAQIQPDLWGKDNEMTSYSPDSLRKYLENDDNVLLLAYDDEKIAGIALCYILRHPAGDDSLYVHELDTHPDYRRRGVSTELMTHLMEKAKGGGLKELWVSTETTNTIADAFYRKLNPYEIEPSFVYAYKTNK